MNTELMQIILLITMPLWVICIVWALFIYISRKYTRTYKIDKDFFYIGGIYNRKKIRLSDISEVNIYHSWLEPRRHPALWTVRIDYSKGKYARFFISVTDAPDYKGFQMKELFLGYIRPCYVDHAM